MREVVEVFKCKNGYLIRASETKPCEDIVVEADGNKLYRSVAAADLGLAIMRAFDEEDGNGPA